METVRLYINETELDLGRFNASLYYQITDINRFSVSAGFTSRTVDLPETSRNQAFFDFLEDYNSLDSLDNDIELFARIEIGGSTLLKGRCKVKRAQIKNSIIYQCVISASNNDWVKPIKDLNIQDLDCSDIDHTYNSTDVLASETAGLDYVYPLINYGKLRQSNTSNDIVTINKRKPALKIGGLLERIYNAQGYKLTSGIKTTLFDNLYLPFTNDLLKNPESSRTNYVFSRKPTNALSQFCPADTDGYDVNWGGLVTYPYNVPFGSASSTGYAGNNYFTADLTFQRFFYTVQQSAKMGFWFDAVIRTTGGNEIKLQLQIILKRSGSYTPIATKEVELSNTSFELHSCFTELPEYIVVQPNDEIFCKIFILEGPDSNETLTISTSSRFYNSISLECIEGNTVRWSENLPDIGQLDLIKTLRDNFNLYFWTDPQERIVYIETEDDFYDPTEVLDWSEKFSMDDPYQITLLGQNLSKTLRFQYTKDSNDKYLEAWQVDNDEEFAVREEELNDLLLKEGITYIQSLFSPTLMRPCPEIGLFNSRVPIMWKEEANLNAPPEFSTDFNFRILYYAGVTNCQSGETWNDAGTERSDYPYMYFYNVTTEDDNNLKFDDTRRNSGLYEKYYRNRIKYLNDSRLLSCSMYLTPNDISNLDFRKVIKLNIKGKFAFFRLQKISSYNPLINKVCKVELLRVVASVPRTPVISIAEDPSEPPQDINMNTNTFPVIYDTDQNEYTVNGVIVKAGQVGIYEELNGVLQPLYEEIDGKITEIIL